MKILLDTNIAMDIITKRDGYEDSLQILKYCEIGTVKGYISALSIADLMYLLRKYIGAEEARKSVQLLTLIIEAADILKNDISNTFLSSMKDFEDSVQSFCAKRINVDYIVTKNIKDFKDSLVPAILPRDLLKNL